ncbi:Nitronate monooxygenase [Mycobacteroides salmoniphilum]|uniref:Propionate 3-nitronate monooxygenase n=1 Tax=Mycobacteroides salmoniphilum TaxID=404941 RepID=A0A4R8RYB1_9MYCO|nr:nitronate monooxygenase [Mycobacteroides salmoniphilum]TDZ78571.1 Nitronate monooxygenase [Mycobacteroides salmoniphilum]
MASGLFDLRDLSRPVIVAPMAGGPSTPELAAAGTNAGGLGFLAAGYLSPEALADRIVAARSLTTGALGVNLFVPQISSAIPEAIRRYAKDLAGEAQRYGVELGVPRFSDDEWAAKLEVVRELRPEVVSFTFGAPSAAERQSLTEVGIATAATVTTFREAAAAAAVGIDLLAAQGPEAGGHRGTYDPTALPATEPLAELLYRLVEGFDVPVIAAGGLGTAEAVDAVIAAGAVAAQLGTAFLLANEAGSSPVHRAALRNPSFSETVVTKSFSGRYARGLRNRFIDEHEAHAPLGYPEVHYLTSSVRAAAVRAGDPQATNVWAGSGFRNARAGSAADIMGELADFRR